MIRSSLHPAPAFVLALAIGGSLTYLWSAPEDSTHAAPQHEDREPPSSPTQEKGAADAEAEQETLLDEASDRILRR